MSKRTGVVAAALLAVLVLAVVALLGAWPASKTAAASSGGKPVSAQTRADIEELIASYANFWEFRYCDAWAGLFATDGTFTEVGVFTVTGYPALVAKCEASNADATTHFHAQVNTMLVQTDNRHVEGLTNLLYGTLSTATAPAALVGYGDYVDQFVRTPDGWRFQSRSASTHKAQGLPPAFLNGA